MRTMKKQSTKMTKRMRMTTTTATVQFWQHFAFDERVQWT